MEQWARVEHYLTDLLVRPDPALEAALEAAAAAGLPRGEVSPSPGKLLELLARIQGARAVLEIGTLGGYSTIWLARALPLGGRLITLEVDTSYARVARAKHRQRRSGRGRRAPRRTGARDAAAAGRRGLPGPFDLIFIDADKQSNPEYLAWALELSRRGTLIVADNVVRGGAVADHAEDDLHVRGVRRFYELLAAEPRVSATAIQTVGAKGYDGFALVLVTADP
ncbi:MAG TPA: O-methyltransferase [Chloroflexota bacterium]